jgi:hypothetical protein
MTLSYQNPLPIKTIGDPFILRAPAGTRAIIVYHSHTDPHGLSGDGSLYVIDPTQTPQPIPSSKE